MRTLSTGMSLLPVVTRRLLALKHMCELEELYTVYLRGQNSEGWSFVLLQRNEVMITNKTNADPGRILHK